MLAYPVLRYKERFWLGTFFWVLGATLGAGFIPTSVSLWAKLSESFFQSTPPASAVALSFPLLALFFYFSFPALKANRPSWGTSGAAAVGLIFATAFGFGLLMPPMARTTEFDWAWIVLAVPIGEELLFRGWMQNLAGRFAGAKWFSFSNPLPGPAVLTSIGFSAWHLQSLGVLPLPLILWQTVYTFFASLWLCAIADRRGLVWCIAAHAALNLLTLLGQTALALLR
jgi:membrane protease YdiL (CAAX protease family)